jgi:hypothetical protein
VTDIDAKVGQQGGEAEYDDKDPAQAGKQDNQRFELTLAPLCKRALASPFASQIDQLDEDERCQEQAHDKVGIAEERL